jgi:hypothetical protein
MTTSAPPAATGDGVIERLGPLSARAWAYLAAAILALAIGDDLLRMPIQVSDALEEILDAYQSPSAAASFWTATFNAAYLRPFRIAQIKLLFDLADGHYWAAYRGFHAALLLLCVWLFTRAMRVKARTDLIAALFGLAALVGMHTFRSTIQEAFPINHFLEIAVAALATVNLAQARPRWWVDATALLLFAAAALTLESGVLVWVVAVAAWLAGWRGISRRGVLLMTGLLGAYFFLRFVSLSVGLPALVERNSGYGLEMLEPSQLEARFAGSRIWWFRTYNVLTSGLSVLLAEPQSGVFVATAAWIEGHAPERHLVAVITSFVTSALLAGVAVAWRRRREPMDDGTRLVCVFAAVLAASAAISFSYTKDDIMSTAGMFYALAAYAAVASLLPRLARMRRASAVAVVTLLVVAATGWTIRSAGIHYTAQSYAFRTRNDWAYQPVRWQRQGRWPSRADERQLVGRLRDEALSMKVANPLLWPPWMEDWWGN